MAASAQAPAIVADSLDTTPGTAPQVAKVVVAGGWYVAEVAKAMVEGARAKADEDRTTQSSPTTGTLRLPKVAATDNSKRSTASSGAFKGEPPSNSTGKRLVRELNVVASAPLKPLEWSNQVITFDLENHPDSTVRVGTLP